MSKACLVDTTRCIGCRACQVACKGWNELAAEQTKCVGTGGGYENPSACSSETFTRITFHEIVDEGNSFLRSVFVKRQCMHCSRPACASACPVAALRKEESGAVVYDAGRCIGCRYCMMACPFGVPTLQWEKRAAYIRKCTFCSDRQHQEPTAVTVNDRPLAGDSLRRFQDSQRTPACANVCPTGAMKFGDREVLIEEARRRIGARPDCYVHHIYGENEVGGTAWMYITNVPFEKLDFRTDLGDTPYPEYTSVALNAIPAAVIGVGAAMGGVYWIVNRRNDVARAEAAQQPGDEEGPPDGI